jgi:hypothetical protein
VYKQTQPGLFNNKVYSASAAKSGKDYSFNIPWSTCFGTASMVKVWLYDQTSKDRLPSSGSVLLKK